MGQYYLIVNLDKWQFLDPHKFDDGLKLLEFGCSAGGTMTALAVLLASGNGRGGGDLDTANPIVGSWAGDRIVVSGDYADDGLWGIEGTLYGACRGEDPETGEGRRSAFLDVSEYVLAALLDDSYLAQRWEEKDGRGFPPSKDALARARELAPRMARMCALHEDCRRSPPLAIECAERAAGAKFKPRRPRARKAAAS